MGHPKKSKSKNRVLMIAAFVICAVLLLFLLSRASFPAASVPAVPTAAP